LAEALRMARSRSVSEVAEVVFMGSGALPIFRQGTKKVPGIFGFF
jgi:hypothetical protein